MMKKKLNCVLLVDDDEATNYLNRMFLEDSGVTENIVVALNGAEAAEYIMTSGKYKEDENNKHLPDLILLDINMPVMDGWEFIQEYRSLNKEQKEKVVIVMLSTSLNPEDQLKAKKINEVSDFKTKPLSFELIDEITGTYFPEYL